MAAPTQAELQQALLVATALPPLPSALSAGIPAAMPANAVVGTPQAVGGLPLQLGVANPAAALHDVQLAPAPAPAAASIEGAGGWLGQVQGAGWSATAVQQPSHAAPGVLSTAQASSFRGSSTTSLLQGITGAAVASDGRLNSIPSSLPQAQLLSLPVTHTPHVAAHPAVGLGGPANLPPSPFLSPQPAAAYTAALPQQLALEHAVQLPHQALPGTLAPQPGMAAGQPGIKASPTRPVPPGQLGSVPELSSVAIPLAGFPALQCGAGPSGAQLQGVPVLSGAGAAPLAASRAGPQQLSAAPLAVQPVPCSPTTASQQLSERLAALHLHSQDPSEAGSARSGGASRGMPPADAPWSTGGSSAASSARASAAAAFAAALDSPSRQLEHAAVASKHLAAQKQAEQHAAAAAYRQAASEAAAAADPVAAGMAAAAAQDAATTFSASASEAAAAQQTSSQLQQAAAVTAAAEASPSVLQLRHAAAATHQVALQKQEEQRAAAAAYQAATDQAAAAIDAAAAGLAMAAAETAAQAFSEAASEAAAAVSVVAASSRLSHGDFTAGMPAVLPQTQAQPTASLPSPSAAAVQLARAAAAAQQVHAQKATQQQAAGAVFHAATAQAATASSPQAQAHAAVAVQQAAAAYTSASSEAAAAANAAQQLQNAALAAVAAPVPASAPLAAAIAAGTPPPLTMPSPLEGHPHAARVAGLAGMPLLSAVAVTSPAAPGVPCGSSVPSVGSSQHLSGSAAASSRTCGNANPSGAYAGPTAMAAPLQAAGPVGAPGMVGAMPAAGPLAAAPLAPAAAVGLVPPAGRMLHVHWAPSSSSGAASSAQCAQAQPSPPHSGYASLSAWSQQAAGIGRTCKVVCSTGGSFVRLSQGGWDYEGGETRLVALPFHCGFTTLVEALERAAAPSVGPLSAESASDAAPCTFAPSIMYRLPSDPSVWVTLMDDDDVALMFDEYDEHRDGASAPSKLHLFVQWCGRQGVSVAGSEGLGSEQHSRQLSGQQHQADLGSVKGGAGAHAEEGTSGASEGRPAGSHPARRGSVDLCALVEKMEIIDPADIQLTRFLGSGGYGDVYLARWHGSDVAVKSMNPSLFFGAGDFSGTNRAAIVDLIKEADLLGSMRHPNVVWVYGIVLPRSALAGGAPSNDDSSSTASERESGEGGEPGTGEGTAAPSLTGTAASRPRSDMVDVIASGMRRGGIAPNMVRPPALVTEYMAGGSLKSALARRADIVAGPLTRVVLALDAAKGLEYLHSKRLVHFDLKSANLLLGYRDRRPVCKVADFGLSKQKLQTYVSGVSSQRGTLPWTAPEILRTPNAVTEKADVYSFGVVMWELWTGLEPYAGLNYHALMLRLANPRERLRPPVPGASDWEGEAPPEPAPGWREVMQRCWSDDPAARPPFSELIADLRGMASAIRPRRDGSSRSAATPQAGAGLPGGAAQQGA